MKEEKPRIQFADDEASPKRAFKGVWIPKQVWLDKRLTPLERCILMEIDSLDNDECCFASNKYIAATLGCSVTSVAQTVTKLKKLGYVKLLGFNGRVRRLKVTLQIRKRKDARE